MKMARLTSVPSTCSQSQIAARKTLKLHIKRIRDREYSKLRALVPSVADKKKVSKVEVIEEAVRYIEELQDALLERFRQKHGSHGDELAEETMKNFVMQLMPESPKSSSLVNFEKRQSRPSFLVMKRRKGSH
ncbi:DNA-binding protein inhibitor ID-4-like [Haliotis rufescens]|uniref:DNA-binding protein inhibitor ID-4-like n=1 Tax=Haliotis rufescens TaxID=6454 RepID=UPI001EB09C66|nr:DNA-binding protein inhibitor ID-4-like [Haliotis rufescens]